MRKNIGKMAFAALLMAGMASPAFAGDWLGIWKVSDTQGESYFIAIFPDGKAASTHSGGISGNWKGQGNAIEVEWATGWKAKLLHEGKKTVKQAFKPGQSFSDKPATVTPAEKVDDGD